MTKKVKISFLILIWGIVSIQSYINWKEFHSKETVETFASIEEDTGGNCITGYAYLGRENLTEKQKEKLLKKLAQQLQMTDDYQITNSNEGDYEQWSLNQVKKDEEINIQIATLEEAKENYIFLTIHTIKSWEEAKKIYEKIGAIYKEMDVNYNVNVETTLIEKGNLEKDTDLRKEVVEELFEKEQAEITGEIDNTDFCTVYGYTKEDSYSQNINGKKVNRQIVFSYSKEEGVTYVKLGCPIINSTY